MGTWINRVDTRASILLDQITGWRIAADQTGIDVSEIIKDLTYQLTEIYDSERPLAKIIDESDIVFHATGPKVKSGLPDLKAFNWICNNANQQLRSLASAVFGLSDRENASLSKKLDLRFSGYAPGSIYAGFKIAHIPAIMSSSGEPDDIYKSLTKLIHKLPTLCGFIDEEDLDYSGMKEVVSDPAVRDASLQAMLRLSPSTQSGIHTIDLSSPESGQQALDTRSRVVLREALKKPFSNKSKFGIFTGDVRIVDLDNNRLTLRSHDIGAIRCVSHTLTAEKGKKLLDSHIRVSGLYEEDQQGRPRLLQIEDLEIIEKPVQYTL